MHTNYILQMCIYKYNLHDYIHLYLYLYIIHTCRRCFYKCASLDLNRRAGGGDWVRAQRNGFTSMHINSKVNF